MRKILGVGAAGVFGTGISRVGLGGLDQGFEVRRETRGRGRGGGCRLAHRHHDVDDIGQVVRAGTIRFSGCVGDMRCHSTEIGGLRAIDYAHDPLTLIRRKLPDRRSCPDLADEGEGRQMTILLAGSVTPVWLLLTAMYLMRYSASCTVQND